MKTQWDAENRQRERAEERDSIQAPGLRADLTRLRADLAAAQSALSQATGTIDDRNGLIHQLRSMLREAGFPDRVKWGEDLHGNEEWVQIRVECQLKDALSALAQAQKERDELLRERKELLDDFGASRSVKVSRSMLKKCDDDFRTVRTERDALAAQVARLREALAYALRRQALYEPPFPTSPELNEMMTNKAKALLSATPAATAQEANGSMFPIRVVARSIATAKETSRMKRDGRMVIINDPDNTGAQVVCYLMPDGHVLLDEIRLPSAARARPE
jgi:hypothetical protein